MFEELDVEVSDFLELTQPIELCELINEAREVLVSSGYTLLEANLFKALPTYSPDVVDAFSSKLLIMQAVREALREVINAIGVRTDCDDVATLTSMLSLLKLAESTVQHDEVCQFIDDDELSLGETLEHILGLVSVEPLSDELLMELGDEFNSTFIDRLNMVHRNAIINETGDAVQYEPKDLRDEAIRKFLANYPNSLVGNLYRNKNILFGEDLDHYVNENNAVLLSYSPASPELAALALVGLATFAGIQLVNMAPAVKTTSQNLYTDMGFKMKLVDHLNKIIQEMSSEQYNKASLL